LAVAGDQPEPAGAEDLRVVIGDAVHRDGLGHIMFDVASLLLVETLQLDGVVGGTVRVVGLHGVPDLLRRRFGEFAQIRRPSIG